MVLRNRKEPNTYVGRSETETVVCREEKTSQREENNVVSTTYVPGGTSSFCHID